MVEIEGQVFNRLRKLVVGCDGISHAKGTELRNVVAVLARVPSSCGERTDDGRALSAFCDRGGSAFGLTGWAGEPDRIV